jgi:hypothetical protein
MHAIAFLTMSVLSLPGAESCVRSVSDGCDPAVAQCCHHKRAKHDVCGSEVLAAGCNAECCEGDSCGDCGLGCGHCGFLCQRKALLCPHGNCGPHFPYEQQPKTYYYFRPYNYRHIAEHQDEAEAWGADRKMPYSNAIFQDVYADLAEQWKAAEPIEEEIAPEAKSESDKTSKVNRPIISAKPKSKRVSRSVR